MKCLGHRLIVKHDEGGGGVFAPSPGTNSNFYHRILLTTNCLYTFYLYVHGDGTLRFE